MDLSGRESLEENDNNYNNNTNNAEDAFQHATNAPNTTIRDENEAATEASALLGKHNSSTTESIHSSASSTKSDASSERSSCSSRSDVVATISKIMTRCFQPPVIAALLGLLFASFPAIRGILVDIDDRDGSAPLQWFFDGLFEAGRAAVPINMIILGCNLSASYMLHSPLASSSSGGSIAPAETQVSKTLSSGNFGTKTTLLVVIGKMVAMPLVGYVSTLILSCFYTVPHEIAGSLYLVLSIVFLCPTANNVMVMVELGGAGKGSKESMARIIACQYAIAPLVLSGTVTGAVLLSSYMADHYI